MRSRVVQVTVAGSFFSSPQTQAESATTWMRRPGSALARISAIRRASHSREAEFVPLMTSLASTGTATGRRTAGSRTTTAAITQVLPYPVFAGPGADPSWNQDAAQTFILPRRRNRVSSIATVTGCPAGTSSATTSRATARPSPPGSQRARAKNRCARSCDQVRDKPAPTSIPHTVRFLAWDKNPQTRSAVTQRIIAHVRRGWPRLGEPIVRHRGQYCCVSALLPGHREAAPILRLRYQGSADRWAIGICLASTGRYTESELPTSFGPKTGTPEEGVDDTFVLCAGPKTLIADTRSHEMTR